jgi:hypothetical protein
LLRFPANAIDRQIHCWEFSVNVMSQLTFLVS